MVPENVIIRKMAKESARYELKLPLISIFYENLFS